MATGSNTRSDSTVKITIKPASPGDCISDKMASEIVRRLYAVLPPAGQVGDTVVSRTPPEDRTKVWALADANGIPTGELFTYNAKTGSWESTTQSIPPIPCFSGNNEQILHKDANGCWLLTEDDVLQIAQKVAIGISSDALNALTAGSDGGVYLNANLIKVSEDDPNFISRDVDGAITAIPSIEAGNAVQAGTDGHILVILPKLLAAPVTLASGVTAAGSKNLATFTTVPTWATHAILYQPNGQMFAVITGGFVNHGALLSGESLILAGFIKAQT